MANFLEGTLGAFYLKQQGTYTARVDLNYVFATIDFLHGPDTTPSDTKAIFGTATIHPTEKLSLTGGLRYTKDEKDYTYFRSNPDGTVPNPAPGGCGLFTQPNCLLAGIYDVTGSFKGDRTDWRAVVDYKFTDNFMAYGPGRPASRVVASTRGRSSLPRNCHSIRKPSPPMRPDSSPTCLTGTCG